MKYLLPFSLLISVLNLCISFFLLSECTINEGIVFGFKIPNPVLISAVFLTGVVALSFKLKGSMRYILLSIVFLGIGNLVERAVRGHICDYIPFFNLSVNLTDICIVILVMLGILICIFNKNGDYNKGGRQR